MDYNNLCPGCFDDSSGQNPCPSCGYSPDSNPGASLYLTPGTLLFNKYLVGRILGQGGFGITYLGWDTNLDIRIAIKEFFPQGLVSRVPGENSVISYSGEIKDQFSFGVESFLRESKTLARFEHHPNIVTVRDFFKENNTAYMVMSFIEGITLLEHLNRSGGRIPVEQAVQIIMPVLDALREVHRAGIMHRDISPDNIFIDREGRIVLIDFGAARQEISDKSKSLTVIFKAGYAPPEQYQSRGQQGPWTDIYAVAATIYRVITGEPPLEAVDRLSEDDLKPPSELEVDIDSTIEAALLKALSIRPKERFQKVEEFQAALMRAGAVKEATEPVEVRERRNTPSNIEKPAVAHDADYYIDYTGGTIPIGDLPIGARVVDRRWKWEFKNGDNYTGSGVIKAITWIVVAKNHYNTMEPHVTLLSEELIGQHAFDYRASLHGFIDGRNHWGESGTHSNTNRGLRPWLNSTGIHSNKNFYRAFSESFKSAVLTTNVPNKEWQNGSAYSTQDKVFLPSTTELGDTEHRDTYQIGSAYPYFQGSENAKRVARLDGETWSYWTRSPASALGSRLRDVDATGAFSFDFADHDSLGVRPALNLKADTLVSEISN